MVERLRRWRANSHVEKVGQVIDRLMLVEVFIMWYIEELEDLKAQLSMDPVLRLLAPIVNAMIKQLWQLMRRWAKVKAEVIREAREGLMKRKRKIEGDGFTIEVLYSKHVIDLLIYLSGGKGDYVRIPSLGIPEAVLRAIRMGWRASDATDHVDKYPAMGTTFAWQAIAWLISMPGAEASVYVQGVSVTKDDVKPVWELKINGFEIEWLSDIDAYQEMARLPRGLFEIAVLHAILGDGSSKMKNGRYIELANDDGGVLELVAKRLEEFKINRPVSPREGAWSYDVSGSNAKTLAKVAIDALKETALAVKRLYDLLGDGSRYTLIWFEKWAKLVRTSVYISNESKVSFANVMWSPDFLNGAIELRIQTKNAEYAERIRDEVKAQGINVAITNIVKRDENATYYEVRIRWSELKRRLCDEELREQLIHAAARAIENCRLRNMTKGRKRVCDKILAAQWLMKLTDPQWLKKHLGCPDPAQRGP